MAFLILLLSCCLIFGTTANFYQNTIVDSKVLINHNYIIPKHYDIQLTPLIYANELKFLGHINAEIEILQPIHIIKLHALQPYINVEQFVLLKNETDKLVKDVQSEIFYHPTSYEYQHTTQVLILYFDTIIVKGTYILKMKFESIMDNDEEKGSFLHKTLHINKSGNKT